MKCEPLLSSRQAPIVVQLQPESDQTSRARAARHVPRLVEQILLCKRQPQL